MKIERNAIKHTNMSLDLCRLSFWGTPVLQPQLIDVCNVAVAAREAGIYLVKTVLSPGVVFTRL